MSHKNNICEHIEKNKSKCRKLILYMYHTSSLKNRVRVVTGGKAIRTRNSQYSMNNNPQLYITRKTISVATSATLRRLAKDEHDSVKSGQW